MAALKSIRMFILAVMLVTIIHCGYRFNNDERSFPVKHLFIGILKNRSIETGMENMLTNDLIYEFSRRTTTVLTDKEDADAVLSGVIKSMRIETIARTDIHTSIDRRVMLTIDLNLVDREGKIIWSSGEMTESEAYGVTPDKRITEQNRKNALSDLSKRLAEKVYNDLASDF